MTETPQHTDYDKPISIDCPENTDKMALLNIENVLTGGEPRIDYYHGSPVIHFYTPCDPNPTVSVVLPSTDFEEPIVYRNGDWENESVIDQLRA